MKKKRQPTHRTSNQAKRVNQDLRELKNKLKRLVDKTKLVWEGKPFEESSAYRFALDPVLVRFIFEIASKALEDEGRAEKETIKMADSVKALEE